MNSTGAQATFRLAADDLQHAVAEILGSSGLATEYAQLVADSLVQAELRGLGSHGVSRLLGIYVQRLRSRAINPAPNIQVVHRQGSVAVVDGDNGPGQVVGAVAMQLAVDLAGEFGSGWVAVRHSSHYGAAAFYLNAALNQHMIGLTTTNAPPNMPPWGGREPYLGTDPIAVAIPAGNHPPIVLDMATSVVAKGKIQLMAKEGIHTIPPNWALDAAGNPTQDVEQALQGMVLPLGGPKGYGLALLVEILSAMLSGAAFGPHLGNLYHDLDRPQNVGHFFGALNISAFTEVADFMARIDQLIDEIKSVPRCADVDEILMPGEIEMRSAQRLRREGIPLAADVYAEIQNLAKELGVGPLSPLTDKSDEQSA